MDTIDLFSFIKNDNLTKVKETISKNPAMLNKMMYGASPLIYSIECNRENIALDLCQSYPDIDLNCKSSEGENVIFKAVEHKMYKIIEIICRNSKKTILNELFENGETLLTDTLKRNDDTSSILLINGGIDINLPNSLNEYPIQLILRHNKLEVLTEMLKSPEIYLRTFDNGYSPLINACELDLTKIALLLIDNGADINFQDDDDDQEWSPLMWAIANGNETIVKKLLEKDCDLSLVDCDGNNVIHLAATAENDVLLKYLLNKKMANKNAVNNDNRTPLSIAQENEDEYCIELLS